MLRLASVCRRYGKSLGTMTNLFLGELCGLYPELAAPLGIGGVLDLRERPADELRKHEGARCDDASLAVELTDVSLVLEVLGALVLCRFLSGYAQPTRRGMSERRSRGPLASLPGVSDRRR